MDPTLQPTALAHDLANERAPKVDIYTIVTQRVIEQLEAGSVPWKKPWAVAMPKNLVSDKNYRGMNTLILGFCYDYSSRYWLSFKQAKEQGGTVKRGEHGAIVVYWKWNDKEQHKELEKKLERETSRAHPFYSRVFNLTQCDGIEAPADDIKTFDTAQLDLAEKIVREMPNPPTIEHVNSALGARGGYSPSKDRVVIPSIERFQSAEEYYAVLFHEITHSTGASSRLARPGVIEKPFFGTSDYGFEELVAELGSAFLCAHCGISNPVIENQAAYLNNWLGALQNDRKMIVLAAQASQKAVDFILKIGKENGND